MKNIKKALLETLTNLHFWAAVGSLLLSLLFQNKIFQSLGIFSLILSIVALFLAVYPLYAFLKLLYQVTSPSVKNEEISFRKFILLLIQFHGKYLIASLPLSISLLIGYNKNLFTTQDFTKLYFVIFATVTQLLYLLFLLIAIGSRNHKNLIQNATVFFTQQSNRFLFLFFALSNLAQKIFGILSKENPNLIYPLSYGLLILFNGLLLIALTKNWSEFYFDHLKST
ncbi:hypothetical protein AB3N59_12555 [Leptospira sp. WS92.C1]